MKILVTGAAGFIGGHLLPFLDVLKHDVVATDVRELPTASAPCVSGYFRWNICHTDEIPAFVEEARGCDAIVHLAAIASPRECTASPASAWDTNVRGTVNVLALAREAGIRRVVFPSSAHVYGISPKYLPTDENHPFALHDTYTMTKIAGESFCDLFFKNYGLSTCALRLYNCYGFGQGYRYFMGASFQRALHEGVVTVRGADITKDWVAVEDVCHAIEGACISNFVGPINVGTGIETSLGDIGRRIALGIPGVSYKPLPTEDAGPTRMCADWSRAKRILGWQPSLPFEMRLDRLIARMKEKP